MLNLTDPLGTDWRADPGDIVNTKRVLAHLGHSSVPPERGIDDWANPAPFAAVHWSLGLASIVAALLFGLLAMLSVMITRSLWPAIAAHWAADLQLFSVPSWLNWMRWTAS